VSGAHFSNEKFQEKVDAISSRTQGKPKTAQDVPGVVNSEMNGTFNLSQALVSF
jgi:hypothetical protein